MKITAKVDVYCPSGFYYMKNGKNNCWRLKFDKNRPYCEIFKKLYLDTDRHGNVLKCEECLIAEREARLNG